MKPRKSRYLNVKPAPIRQIRGQLVVVDNVPIRNRALKDYEDSRLAFQRIKDEVAQFHRLDKPQFERWLRDHFCDLIQQVTTVKGQVSKLNELIFEVETRTWLKNQSFAAAYRDVMERRARNNGRSSDEDLEDLKSRLNEKMDVPLPEDRDGAMPQQPTAPMAAKLGAEKMSRLKAAYRSMARRFHPDCNADLTQEMLEVWYEAQRAYLAGDVELLESIDAAAHENDPQGPQRGPVSSILRRTEQLMNNHRALLRKIEDLQRDPSWGFASLTNTSKLKKKMAKELPEELKSLKQDLKKLQTKINSWKEDAERYYPGFREAHAEPATDTPPTPPHPKAKPSSKAAKPADREPVRASPFKRRRKQATGAS